MFGVPLDGYAGTYAVLSKRYPTVASHAEMSLVQWDHPSCRYFDFLLHITRCCHVAASFVSNRRCIECVTTLVVEARIHESLLECRSSHPQGSLKGGQPIPTHLG